MCDKDRQIIRQLQEEITLLREENERLKARIEELERLLASYENANTPPSLKRKFKKKPNNPSRKPGRPSGHKGSTRPRPKPDRVVNVTKEECPYCKSPLGEPVEVESRIIEEIPEPQPIIVTEFRVAHYNCPSCGNHVIATDPNCPREGRFGKRALAHITLLKYSERLPHRKVCETLEREFGLCITPATVLDITRRVRDELRTEYDAIGERIRNAKAVSIDETGMRVNGRKYWIWVFTTDSDTLVVIRRGRGKKVLKEVLGKNFRGIIICDGWRSYASFSKRLQRCWAHLLREAKFIGEKFSEAIPLYDSLRMLYRDLTDALGKGPPLAEREKLWEMAYQKLCDLTKDEYAKKEINNFVGKIKNGLKHFLTFVITPGVEPTNNRAERALREHVVIRKIIGTLRNEKGTQIHETITSCLATWKQQGLNPYQQIITKVS